jgi:diketogulonate reductase-like aldo/keto reductase
MEAVQASGKARAIGVSNFGVAHLRTVLATATVVPAVNQTEYHPYLTRGPLVPFCAEQRIAVAAYGPLTPITRARGGDGAVGTATAAALDGVLARLAPEHRVSEGAVLLRWALEQGLVVVTTSAKEARLRDYLAALAFRLTPAEVDEITAAGAGTRYRAFWKKTFEDGNWE